MMGVPKMVKMPYNIVMNRKKTENETGSGMRIFSGLFASRKLIMAFSIILLVSAGSTFLMYKYTQNLLTERLQERLIAIASTAATKFDSSEINSVQTEDDRDSKEFASLVRKLGEIRESNSNIQFAYLMRRSEDPNIVNFIADADALSPVEDLDENENGILDAEEQPPGIGDPYEVGDYPVLRDEAFYHPAVDRELQPDQWGLIMAAYAPIVDASGNTVAIVGIDVLVDDFVRKTNSTLLPFLLFIFALLLLITYLTYMLLRMSEERVEVMRELDRQKDELLSIVSHQLATPVSSVKFSLEMLQDGDYGSLEKEQTKHISMMQSTVNDLKDLIAMILDVSRIQLGRMKVDRSDVNLSDFFEEVLSSIRVQAKEKAIVFKESMPEQLPIASFDKRLLRMTLENLLSNAVKYTPEKGEVKIDVNVNDGVLMYEVVDTGCGIPKADQDKMFTKLYRASNVLGVQGNGFGLYVAKGAVESQGGSIDFTSIEGKGTTFSVSLPLVDPKQ